MEQYDAIAGDYQEIAAAVPLREPEWYSLRLRLGDLWDDYVATPSVVHFICQK
jgi:hypothetical protein